MSGEAVSTESCQGWAYDKETGKQSPVLKRCRVASRAGEELLGKGSK